MTKANPNPKEVEGFFQYIIEREAVRRRRAAGEPPPWSALAPLNEFRFTNIKREYDRTTQNLLKLYRQHSDAPPEEVVFNCGLYRYFGTAEFAEAVGWVTHFNRKEALRIEHLATARREQRQPVFTGAYVVTNGGIAGAKQSVVLSAYMAPLWAARKVIAHKAATTRSLAATAAEFAQVPGFGGSGFMAKEAMLDMMFFPFFSNPVDRKRWSLCGPGARKGLNIIWDRDPKASMTHAAALEEMMFLHDLRKQHLPKDISKQFKDLHDIQWNLCEYSKLRTIQRGGRGKRTFKPTAAAPARKGAKPSGKRTLTDAQMVEVYNYKVATGESNKNVAERFGLRHDSDVHRAIHRAIKRGLVDGEEYRNFKAGGRRYGSEGTRDYTHKEHFQPKRRAEENAPAPDRYARLRKRHTTKQK